MDNATSTTVETELREFAESRAMSSIGQTITALLRTDRNRLKFWPASAAVAAPAVQKLYAGDEEQTVFFAVERYHEMRAGLGFVMDSDKGPTPGAWLVVNGDAVIDPAGNVRTAAGYFGVELTMVEASRWTPTQRSEVGRRGVSGLAL
jgi:hypothetical protein